MFGNLPLFQLYPPEHYLSGPELLFKYSPGLITEVTNSLTPQEVLVVLQNKSFKGFYYANKFDWPIKKSFRFETIKFHILSRVK